MAKAVLTVFPLVYQFSPRLSCTVGLRCAGQSGPDPRRRFRSIGVKLPGDYVVHANHGVAQFMGIRNMTVNGVTRDYLYLRYAADDALYVPTDQVDVVERYVGPEGVKPALQRLGSGEWQRIKARVKKSIEDLARNLLMLEAKRKSRQGFPFSPDTPWQRQFEEEFEYEDTEDQALATPRNQARYGKQLPYGPAALRGCWIRQD